MLGRAKYQKLVRDIQKLKGEVAVYKEVKPNDGKIERINEYTESGAVNYLADMAIMKRKINVLIDKVNAIESNRRDRSRISIKRLANVADLKKDEYTANELAGILKLNYQTITRMIRSGRIKAEKEGNKWVIKRRDLQNIEPRKQS